jgi:hypothetical protein
VAEGRTTPADDSGQAIGYPDGMEPTQQTPRTVDVTGLSEQAIRIVENLVANLRQQTAALALQQSREEWLKAFHEWAESHRRLDKPLDCSRESIYEGRGE